MTRPFVVWKKVFGQLGVDGFRLGRTFEVGLLLEEHVDVVLQQPQVRLVGVLVLSDNEIKLNITCLTLLFHLKRLLFLCPLLAFY